jgi:hypothetical protein
MKKCVTFSKIILCEEQAKDIYDALVSSGHDDLATMLVSKAPRSPIDRQFIDALPHLDENDFSVDDQPVVSMSRDGAYVMVWRWVSNEDAGLADSE